MPTSPLSVVIQHLRAGLRPDGDGMTDGELLARFLGSRDEDAIAALVRRHARMVWGVNRRLLNHHDAEDAFQATFLVLVRKAADVPGHAVANWLYGVARQTAVRLRALAAKRGQRETQMVNMAEPTAVEVHDADLQAVVDEELSRLPDHYRGVIVLCDLDGMTRKEAARQLGIPEGSVASRLARARALLAKRLHQRGVTLSAGALATILLHNTASGSVPALVVSNTIKVTDLIATRQATLAGAVSGQVASLTEGVIKAMLITKLKAATATVVAITLCGMTGLICQTLAKEPGTPALPRTLPTLVVRASTADALPDVKKNAQRGEDIVPVDGGPRTTVPRAMLYPDVAGQTHVIGRLTVNDHAMKQDTQVYSVGLEIDNLTGRTAMLQFDPKDLKLELLDAKGNVVEESATVRSGPAPIAHKATIPTSGYVGISTYRGGIGLTPKSILLAAGLQAWVVKPGVYRVRGTATVSVDFGAQVLDPEKPDAPESKQGDETHRLKINLIECRFALQREKNAPDE